MNENNVNEKYTMFKTYHLAAKRYANGNMRLYGRLMYIINCYGIENSVDLENLSRVERLFFDLIQVNIDNSLEIREKNKARQEKAVNARLQKKSTNIAEGETTNVDVDNENENENKNALDVENKEQVENKETIETVETVETIEVNKNDCEIVVSDKQENTNKEAEKKSKRFVKPTIDEIEAYCKERSNNINANRFFDFYESKDWFVGKNKMKDWKACVRTWEAKDDSSQQRTFTAFDYEAQNYKGDSDEWIKEHTIEIDNNDPNCWEKANERMREIEERDKQRSYDVQYI